MSVGDREQPASRGRTQLVEESERVLVPLAGPAPRLAGVLGDHEAEVGREDDLLRPIRRHQHGLRGRERAVRAGPGGRRDSERGERRRFDSAPNLHGWTSSAIISEATTAVHQQPDELTAEKEAAPSLGLGPGHRMVDFMSTVGP